MGSKASQKVGFKDRPSTVSGRDLGNRLFKLVVERDWESGTDTTEPLEVFVICACLCFWFLFHSVRALTFSFAFNNYPYWATVFVVLIVFHIVRDHHNLDVSFHSNTTSRTNLRSEQLSPFNLLKLHLPIPGREAVLCWTSCCCDYLFPSQVAFCFYSPSCRA